MLGPDAPARIRHARWEKRLSIRALSRKAQISTTTIVKIEAGNLNVRGEIVYAIAAALDLDAETLFRASEGAA